ncbi:amidohydrolase [Sinobacterium caligoides]|nr:amidohydrolase [Sinobacterium caligoides]
MDPTLPEATAVAVRDGRIISVGTLEELRPWLSSAPHRVDQRFADKIIFPGLIDPHMHPLLGAIQLSSVWITPEQWQVLGDNIPATKSPESYWLRLKEAVKQDANSDTPIFITWGWSAPEHGPMTRKLLDERLGTEKPVMVWQRSAHAAVFNSAALNWMKLKESDIGEQYAETINYREGSFTENGFFEVAVTRLASYILAPKFIDAGFDRLNQYLQGNGVTTVSDMSFGAVNIQLEVDNYQRNLVDKQVFYRTVIVPDAYKVALQNGGLEVSFNLLDERLNKPSLVPQIVNGRRVKFFSDGAMFSQMMKLHPPGYIDGHKGQWLTPREVFLQQAQKYWDAGYRIHVHANGDAGIDNALDILQAIQAKTTRPPHSFIIEHYGYADDRINRRTADLGAAVSANPYYLYLLGDSYSEVGLGYDRAGRIVPLSGLVDRGVPVALHSDFGMAPSKPLLLAWAAMTRMTVSGKEKIPPRALTVDEALKAVTIDAAYILGLDRDIGSIQSGKKADFVVLEKNPYSVKPDQLREIKIIGTVFEGRVHER